MFLRQKMAMYPVKWSLDIKYNNLNEFPDHEDLVDDI